jgi:hypothetical protein
MVFCVGFVQYDFNRGAWGFAKGRNREVGGFVAYALPAQVDSRRKHLIIAASGPLANMLLAGILGVGLMLTAAVEPPRPQVLPALEDASGSNRVGVGELEPVFLPSAEVIDSIVAEERANRAMAGLYRDLETLAILLILASLGAAVVNLLPFHGSDGEAIRANWRR